MTKWFIVLEVLGRMGNNTMLPTQAQQLPSKECIVMAIMRLVEGLFDDGGWLLFSGHDILYQRHTNIM